MIVKDLIKELQEMPDNAEVVTAKDIDGAWTVISGPLKLTKYENLDVCIVREGY